MKWTNKIENFFRANRNAEVSPHTAESIATNQTHIPIGFDLDILIIADTHGCLNEAEIPTGGYDVCLILGDVYDNDLAIVVDIVKNVPIYGILGNHDSFYLFDRWGIENIHGKCVTVNGIKISGMQGSIRYKNSDAPLYYDDESSEIAATIPSADIFISHDSAKYVFTQDDFAHSGLQGITDYCNKNNPPLHIHGHHHENKTTILENGTTSICCYGVRLLKGEEYGKQN